MSTFLDACYYKPENNVVLYLRVPSVALTLHFNKGAPKVNKRATTSWLTPGSNRKPKWSVTCLFPFVGPQSASWIKWQKTYSHGQTAWLTCAHRVTVWNQKYLTPELNYRIIQFHNIIYSFKRLWVKSLEQSIILTPDIPNCQLNPSLCHWTALTHCV